MPLSSRFLAVCTRSRSRDSRAPPPCMAAPRTGWGRPQRGEWCLRPCVDGAVGEARRAHAAPLRSRRPAPSDRVFPHAPVPLPPPLSLTLTHHPLLLQHTQASRRCVGRGRVFGRRVRPAAARDVGAPPPGAAVGGARAGELLLWHSSSSSMWREGRRGGDGSTRGESTSSRRCRPFSGQARAPHSRLGLPPLGRWAGD